MERRFHKEIDNIGRLVATFKSEKFVGEPLLDTEVIVPEGALCWISYPDKEQFLRELNLVISKYCI